MKRVADITVALQIVALALGVLVLVSIIVAAMMSGIRLFLKNRGKGQHSKPE